MGVYQATVDLTWSGATGSPGVNVWAARSTGDAGPGQLPTFDLSQAATALENFYQGIINHFPSAVTVAFDGSWTRLDGENKGDQVNAGHAWSHTGSGGSGFAPPGLCEIADLRSSNTRRSGRGRKFIGPLSNAVPDSSGALTQGRRDELLTALNGMITFNQGQNNGAFVIWSRKDQVGRDITGASVPSKLGMVRSRRD